MIQKYEWYVSLYITTLFDIPGRPADFLHDAMFMAFTQRYLILLHVLYVHK